MKKWISFLLCAVLAVFSTACNSEDGNISSSGSPLSSGNSMASSGSLSSGSSMESSSKADSFDTSVFQSVENGLKDLGLSYTKKDADAGLAKAEKGVTYTFSDGKSIDVYLFNDANLLEEMANSAMITIEGIGEMPVEMNNNLILLAGNAPEDEKQKIIDMFKKL